MMHALDESSGAEVARVPIAPEHVLRVLHELDTDFDELCTEADVLRYVREQGLAFSEALVHSMFAEANSSGDGRMDLDQLGKDVASLQGHAQNFGLVVGGSPRPSSAARSASRRFVLFAAIPWSDDDV